MAKTKVKRVTKCSLCNKDVVFGGTPEERKGKHGNEHHIQYEYDGTGNAISDTTRGVVVPLCYICHCIVHLRLQFHNPYHKRFGADFAGYFMARDIMQLYTGHPEVIEAIKKKFPGEFK